jgi:3-deoxy-manno-octulosonate cytidylyltransferase (CMP-KDO synthetase)
MKIIACIPARLQSTRLANKLLLPLGDLSILATTYQNALNTNLFDEVIAICDKAILADEITNIGGKVWMSKHEHESGTDRIAEFLSALQEYDIILNIQADEPFIHKNILEKVILTFEDSKVQVATCRYEITDIDQINNPNHVKVICDENDFALYFSRSVIPYQRSIIADHKYYKHIGIYAFRPEALKQFSLLTPPVMERMESLENLRYIYYHIPVKLVTIDEMPISIDTREDYEMACERIAQKK